MGANPNVLLPTTYTFTSVCLCFPEPKNAFSSLSTNQIDRAREKIKVAFVAGVADSSGYGWAICKALAEAGATVTVGTWPPVLGIFEKSLKKGSFDEDMKLEDGSKFEIAKVHECDRALACVWCMRVCALLLGVLKSPAG